MRPGRAKGSVARKPDAIRALLLDQMRKAACTRPYLCRVLKLHQDTGYGHVDALLAEKLIVEEGQVRTGKGGRRPTLYRAAVIDPPPPPPPDLGVRTQIRGPWPGQPGVNT